MRTLAEFKAWMSILGYKETQNIPTKMTYRVEEKEVVIHDKVGPYKLDFFQAFGLIPEWFKHVER